MLVSGALSAKIYLAADLRCRLLARVTRLGNGMTRSRSRRRWPNLGIVRLGRGRPRARTDAVLANKACSTAKIRAHLRRRGITATIPALSTPGQMQPRWATTQSGP